MKLSIQAGSTSQTVNVFIRDSSSTTGAGLTGLAYNTASLTAYYALPRATPVSITLATQTVTGAFSSGGFVQLDATAMPGWYRLDIPDAAIATGRFVSLHLKGATNMAPLPIEIELTAWNNQDSVRGGMTALPNAAANANGGLPILSGSGTTLAYTISTLTTYTGNTPQTGDSFARIGANGAGLTALGDTRIANLDATITSRMATFTYTAPPSALDIWSHSTRVLTAGTNIVLTKGTGVTGFNDILAADVWAVTTRVLTAGTNIQLPANGLALVTAWTVAITGNITGNLSGSVGTVNALANGAITAASIAASALSGKGDWLTTLGATAPAGWINASSIAADALDGKGDWNTTTPNNAAILAIASTLELVGGGVYRFTEPALALAPSGSGSSPEVIALAVDELLSTNHGAGQWGSSGSGSGAFTITVTVTDGADPLQNTTVRLLEGVNAFTATTDADGQAVFALDAATYNVAVTKAGYQFTPTTRTVTGNEAGTLVNDLEMAAVVIPIPADPGQTTAFLDVFDDQLNPASNVQFTFAVVSTEAENQAHVSSFTRLSEEGRLETTLLKETSYTCKRGDGVAVAFTTSTAGSYALPTVLGTP